MHLTSFLERYKTVLERKQLKMNLKNLPNHTFSAFLFFAQCCHLFRAIFARNSLFVEQNSLFSTQNSKNACCLDGCNIINAINLKKWVVKIHNCALSLDLFTLFELYRTHLLIFLNKPCQENLVWTLLHHVFNNSENFGFTWISLGAHFL